MTERENASVLVASVLPCFRLLRSVDVIFSLDHDKGYDGPCLHAEFSGQTDAFGKGPVVFLGDSLFQLRIHVSAQVAFSCS